MPAPCRPLEAKAKAKRAARLVFHRKVKEPVPLQGRGLRGFMERLGLLLPAVLEAVDESNFLFMEQRVSLHSGMNVREVYLRARYSGRGRLRIVAEYMYDPSRSYVFHAGEITVGP